MKTTRLFGPCPFYLCISNGQSEHILYHPNQIPTSGKGNLGNPYGNGSVELEWRVRWGIGVPDSTLLRSPLMCRCTNTSRNPAPALTGTDTGIPALAVLLLLCLAQIWHWVVVGAISSALDRLHQARRCTECLERNLEHRDDLPLSEWARGYLETFAEDHHTWVPFLFPEPQPTKQ